MSTPIHDKANSLLKELMEKLNIQEKLSQLSSDDYRKSDVQQITGDIETNLSMSNLLDNFKVPTAATTLNSAANELRELMTENKETSQNLEQ
jgi:hypothetical protein